MKVILVQAAAKGGYKCIHMELAGDTLAREYGLVGGKMQTTSNTYKALNVGKKNEKSPECVALEDYERILKKKTEEGYREISEQEFRKISGGEFREDHSSDLDVLEDFLNPPRSFTCSKPITSISDKKLDRLILDCQAIIGEKENGLCHWIFVDFPDNHEDMGVRIFTRRMDDHTAKYPGIVKAVQALPIGGQTVFATELVINPTGDGHLADFKKICGISRADTVKGELKFVDGRLPKTEDRTAKNVVRAMIFHVLWLNGQPLWSEPYHKAHNWLTKNIPAKDVGGRLFHQVLENFESAGDLRAGASANRARNEGYVIWDRDACAEVGFTGKPKRRACWKAKPVQETDVVVTELLMEGRGKRQGKVGALQIGAYDENGIIVDLGKVGSGLTDESAEPGFWPELPCTIMIEYAEQFETGKFQFPVFKHIHPDKSPSEVVI